MIDITVLRTLRTKQDYNKYRSSIPLRALEEHTRIIVEDIDKYYKQYPEETKIDMVTFKDCFFQHWHRNMPEDRVKYFNKIIDHVDAEIAPSVKDSLVNSLITLQTATDLGNLVESYQQEDEIDLLAEVEQLIADAREKQKANDDEYVFTPPSLAEVLSDDTDNTGVPWPIEGLNNHCRKLRGGDQVIIAGRPGTGKTSLSSAFAIAGVTHRDDERPVLWLSNEGTLNSIYKRAIQCALGDTIPGLLARQQAGTLDDDYLNVVGSADRLQIREIGGYTNIEVKALIEAVKPKMVILDMIDKIKFMGMDTNAREDRIQEEKYAWFRELAIKLDYISIPTSQISASAEETEATSLWPRQDMLKDSRTGKQGACDTILMMGVSQDPMKSAIRTFSTPKTKHELYGKASPRLMTTFDAQRCRFMEMGD